MHRLRHRLLCCRHFLVIDMGLEKAIKHGKEHRKPFGKGYGNYPKSVDPACRNHGGCPVCEGNRTYSYRKMLERTDAEIKSFLMGKL